MIYSGLIKNGVAVLDSDVALPDGTHVRVEISRSDFNFWDGKSVEDLAHEQGVKPITNVADLAIDWPQEDPIDEFLSLLNEVRH